MSGGLTLAGRAFTQEHLLHILVHARLDTVEGLGVALQDWNSASRAVSDTLWWKVDAAALQVINRPGAWLLLAAAATLVSAYMPGGQAVTRLPKTPCAKAMGTACRSLPLLASASRQHSRARSNG